MAKTDSSEQKVESTAGIPNYKSKQNLKLTLCTPQESSEASALLPLRTGYGTEFQAPSMPSCQPITNHLYIAELPVAAATYPHIQSQRVLTGASLSPDETVKTHPTKTSVSSEGPQTRRLIPPRSSPACSVCSPDCCSPRP